VAQKGRGSRTGEKNIMDASIARNLVTLELQKGKSKKEISK